MTRSIGQPSTSNSANGESANLPAVLVLVAFGITLRLVGTVVFEWSVPHPPVARHCLLGLGLQVLALAFALRRRPDYALLVSGFDFVWIAMLTPRFGTASMLFLFGLIHPFLVLVMTRWSVELRILLAVLPPAGFAVVRFSTFTPQTTDLLTTDQLRHLATTTVLVFVTMSMTITVHTLRVVERSRRRAEHLAEARSRLLDDMSHELRTPVSIVLTTAQAALTRERSRDAYRDSLHLVERQARGLGRILHRMLELSRAERADVAVCPVDDLVPAVHRIVDGYRDLAVEKSVELELVAGLVDARTDAAVLQIVLGNLLTNAIRYTPEGSQVEIRVDGSAQRPHITVRDHGPGIAAGDLPHIFERYWRADKARSRAGGEGLGLAIARHYARLIGATIDVDSEPGLGATFTVRW